MLRAKKSLGQNFLINPGILNKIVAAAEVNKDDVILEIGPGAGNLTEKLAEKVRSTGSEQTGRVIAVEKDHHLIELLKIKFPTKSTNSAIAEAVDIVEGDILKFSPSRHSLVANYYKIIGNIPYYITSHLIKTIFEEWPTPKLIVLMVQKEVAQRVIAKPPPKNGKAVSEQAHMNLLALSIQFYAKPKIISYVSKGSFRPIPKIDSAIIVLKPETRNLKLEQKDKFFKLIKIAFAGKRKQLKNTIGKEVLEGTGIKPESRPEELSLEDWIRIASQV